MASTMTFPRFLALRREALGRTQAEIGQLCGITGEAVCQFEVGRRKPRLALLTRLADALQVDRRLLGRYALESRAPEFYAALGLAPVEEQELESARQRTRAENPLVEDADEEEEAEGNWMQRADGRGWLEPDGSAESPKRPC